MISVFFNFLRFDLWPKMWYILENVPCALEKELHSSVSGWNVLKISMRSISSNVSFKTYISLLIFCFNDLFIDVSGMLKSPTIIVLLSISPFLSVSVCLKYWGLLCWVHRYLQLLCLPLGLSLLSIYVSCLISCNILYFKVFFSGMRIATPAFFCFPFAWNIFFHPFTFSLYVSLGLLGFLWTAYIWVLFLYPFRQSVSFGWSI